MFPLIVTLQVSVLVLAHPVHAEKGLPLAVQLVGPRFRDEALFDAAAWVEARLAV